MCGVFGWVKYNGPINPDQLQSCRAATSSMYHRGPDAKGEWLEDGVFMGHRRLSIIDLSNHANQPFHSADDRYVITFNGEIYNYLEIREDLKSKGHIFRTESDTEVLIYALVEWGKEGLKKLDGMFAGAFYDRKTGKCLIFRDPLGQKPMYIHQYDGGIVYASELRAFLELNDFKWSIDKVSFRHFLTSSYYPWNLSPINNIKKLLPGYLLEVENGKVNEVCWWDSIPGKDSLDIGMNEALDEFDKLFNKSCNLSMRSDVPVGIFLSGGLDSSRVLTSCNDINPNVKAYSVSMSERDYDESSKALIATNHIGCEHKIIQLNQESLLKSFNDLMEKFDEPHGDPGFVNTYFLSQKCRSEITVAMAGDGADEILGGYAPFRGLKIAKILELLPTIIIDFHKSITRSLPASDSYLGLQFKAIAFLQAFPSIKQNRNSLWLSTLPSKELSQLMPKAEDIFFDPMQSHGAFNLPADLYQKMSTSTPTQQLLYFYQKLFLPEFVCHHTDRAAMLNSMEVRSPFLSIPLVEFVNRLPDKLKGNKGSFKILLRRSLEKRGFPEAITKQKKQGFTFPLARWLKDQMLDLVMELNDDIEVLTGGEVSSKELKKIINQHLSGHRNNYRIIYNLIVFNAWRKRYPGLDFA